mgnify:CR=1 FL=1
MEILTFGPPKTFLYSSLVTLSTLTIQYNATESLNGTRSEDGYQILEAFALSGIHIKG